MASGVQPASHGGLSVVHRRAFDRDRALGLVFDATNGHYRRERAGLLLHNKSYEPPPQQWLLTWFRDHISPEIPRWWYNLVLGHDLHVSTYAELYVQHYHATERDPFTGEMGWLENVGLVSRGKVTTAFRDFETAQLVAETSTYGDFKFHEVGTSAAAEANTQTALTTTTGIARATGTQVDVGSGVYRSVATVTADTSETWQEHGIFNISTAGTMMDRSLISPTVAVVASDTVTFTYELTKTAEA
jgi:hypothetical protein